VATLDSFRFISIHFFALFTTKDDALALERVNLGRAAGMEILNKIDDKNESRRRLPLSLSLSL